MKWLYTLFLLGALLSCDRTPAENFITKKTNENLKYFGFTLVDVFFDDPTDKEEKTNYLDEVSPFTNIADILVIDENQDIKANLEQFRLHHTQAIFHLHELFFVLKEEGGDLSGKIYELRSDFSERWNNFVLNNSLEEYKDIIASWYLGEEPTWNGIGVEDLRVAAQKIKEWDDEIPIMMIEAYPALERMEIPEEIDWVGFDHYFLDTPHENEKYISDWNVLESKRKAHQKIVLVMDSHYIPLFHGLALLTKKEMADVAASYYKLANENKDVVAVIGYHWPSGFEFSNTVGARHLPENVQEVYRAIGKEITGK